MTNELIETGIKIKMYRWDYGKTGYIVSVIFRNVLYGFSHSKTKTINIYLKNCVKVSTPFDFFFLSYIHWYNP